MEELELRVLLGAGDDGVCQVIVEERAEAIYVRVLVHCRNEEDALAKRAHDFIDCPVRVWLDEPLGGRVVVDFDSAEELSVVPHPDHGCHDLGRRQPGFGRN